MSAASKKALFRFKKRLHIRQAPRKTAFIRSATKNGSSGVKAVVNQTYLALV
jgi:hypothetical protein